MYRFYIAFIPHFRLCIVCISLYTVLSFSISFLYRFRIKSIIFTAKICYGVFEDPRRSDAALAVVSTCRYATAEPGITGQASPVSGVLYLHLFLIHTALL